MLPLRYSRVWRAVGVFILAAVFVGTILPSMGFWPDVAFSVLVAFDKWQHAFAFLILALWFSGQYEKRFYWRIGLGLLIFGGVIEVIQRSLAYRTADIADMVANVVGISAGLALAVAGLGGWSQRVEGWLGARQAGEG